MVFAHPRWRQKIVTKCELNVGFRKLSFYKYLAHLFRCMLILVCLEVLKYIERLFVVKKSEYFVHNWPYPDSFSPCDQFSPIIVKVHRHVLDDDILSFS